MTKRKQVATIAIVSAIAGGLYLLTRKAKVEEPPAPPPGLANLYGKVTDAQTGIASSGVLVSLNGLQAYTDSSGNYTFTDLEIRAYSITFQKEGFLMASRNITLVEGNNVLNVQLLLSGAKFKVTNLVISHTAVQIGYPVSISCLITNIGTAGSYTVILGGDFMAEQSVYLAPGESRIVSFNVTPTEVKTYSVSVDGLSGSFIATTTPVANIRVENLTITPSWVYVGQTVTISVIATNYGTAAGTKKINFTVI